MEIILALMALLAVIGITLALYEWRKGKVVLRHDLSLDQESPDTKAELERAVDRSRDPFN